MILSSTLAIDQLVRYPRMGVNAVQGTVPLRFAEHLDVNVSFRVDLNVDLHPAFSWRLAELHEPVSIILCLRPNCCRRRIAMSARELFECIFDRSTFEALRDLPSATSIRLDLGMSKTDLDIDTKHWAHW